jgi:hypothetical protein
MFLAKSTTVAGEGQAAGARIQLGVNQRLVQRAVQTWAVEAAKRL